MLPDIHNGFNDAIAIICQQFESLGHLIQTESVRDHKIGLDPAFADKIDNRIDTLILAPNVNKGESFALGIVHRKGALICLRNAHDDKSAHWFAQFHGLVKCGLLATALKNHVQFQGFALNYVEDNVRPIRIACPCSALLLSRFQAVVQPGETV
jgi:hypothetical protein